MWEALRVRVKPGGSGWSPYSRLGRVMGLERARVWATQGSRLPLLVWDVGSGQRKARDYGAPQIPEQERGWFPLLVTFDTCRQITFPSGHGS